MNLSSQAGVINSNPTTSGAARGVKRKAWAGLKTLGGVLSKRAGTFGPLKSAVDDVSRIVDILEGMALGPDAGDPLADNLDTLFGDVAGYIDGPTPPSMMSSIRDFAEGVKKEMEIIQSKRPRTGAGKLQEAIGGEDKAEECYGRIQRLLSRLALNANLDMWKTANEEVTERLLNKLPDSPAAKYCSSESVSLGRGECTKDTRTELLRQIRDWACDDRAERIYWLNGMAGTGKTTIAYSLCEYLQTTQKLGASFFCSQRLSACRDVNRIVPSIAYRLSRFSPAFRQALSRALERDDDAYNQVLGRQFGDLLAAPLQEVTRAFPTNVVVVIDALDECDDKDGVGQVLQVLLAQAVELPVKFFVTSRPEPNIVDRMQKPEAHELRKELRLHELDRSDVQKDIKTYLKVKLARVKLSTAQLEALAERSGVLFIYAATMVRYLEYKSFSWCRDRLKTLLEESVTTPSRTEEGLDKLYTTILSVAFEDEALEECEKDLMREVLGHIICAREPLSTVVLADLLGRASTESVRAALRPLYSVLNVSRMNEIVTTLHESFPNYMFNQLRSGNFHCCASRHHARIAQRCFDLIRVPNPPFNICKLESSYLLDEEVPGISQRVDQAISQALWYACRYWAAHLALANHSPNLSKLLYELLSERLLLWMEVMNLKKQLWEGPDMLRTALVWCKGHVCSKHLELLIQDASMFVSVVSSSQLSRSTPHIYISALPFWPNSRPVTKHYLPKLSRSVKVAGTAMAMAKQEFTPAILTLSKQQIYRLAYSPDGKHIAFTDGADHVTIWNIRTGRCEAEFDSDEIGLTAVTFSHDGLHIILGYYNGTIRIWGMRAREMIGDPLRCHSSTDLVVSITCSPGGDNIATGSLDGTVRIWNRRTGQIIASLYGSTGMVLSIAYSPDDAYIASCSSDGTVHVWDVSSGQVSQPELSSYQETYFSIVFSPDSTQVACSSARGEVKIWDTRTGELVKAPIIGHTDLIYSIQYSPSGLHLVSGSADGTVCVWDVHSGQMITELLNKSLKPVNWVSYSSDGTHILACSTDGTLYIWDSSILEVATQRYPDHPSTSEESLHAFDSAQADFGIVDQATCVDNEVSSFQTTGQLLEGHAKGISSIAYSPDGTHIVSGSWDMTLRIWDARTGSIVGQPLRGHTHNISAVSFSPDGTRIVSGSSDHSIRIWDVSTCRMLGVPLIGHTDSIGSVSYSPDGVHIASGSGDKTIRIWDAYSGKVVRPPVIGHTGRVNSLSHSPCGAFLVSGSEDTTIRIWDSRTSRTVGLPLRGHSYRVNSVAYSPTGLYIVSRSLDSVCVWDARAGSMIGQIPQPGHGQLHCTSPFSPGANLSLKYLDGAIHISQNCADWDFVQPLKQHHGDVRLEMCLFSPNGTHVASGYSDGTIRLSSIHIRQFPDAEMKSHGNEPRAIGPCTCSTCTSHLDWSIWKFNRDGWAVTRHSQKLIWVPPHLHTSLQLPHNTAMISTQGTIQLEFDRSKLGISWSECYTPRA